MLGLHNFGSAQEKIVKLFVDSSTIYLRYFYKSKTISDEYPNDSVRLVARKITEDKIYLDKYIYKRKAWTKIYKLELAKDSLHITTRIGGRTGKNQFEYSKEPYYNSFLIGN
jgi:hypothetical protein